MQPESETTDWTEAYAELSNGFSPWMPWRGISARDFMQNPGVYLFAELDIDSFSASVVDPRIIYIGETTKQTLLARFVQFEEAARTGCQNRHLGGQRYFGRTKGTLLNSKCRLLPDDFYVSVFPVNLSEPSRGAYIRFLERTAIWYFVKANIRYPTYNTL